MDLETKAIVSAGFLFRHKSYPGYRNINEIYPQHESLHVCETLFGDRGAQLLLLLQDAASFQKMKALFESTGKNPFRHDPSFRTNKNLFKILRGFFPVGDSLETPNNRSCGVYYANSVWLLKETDGAQGELSDPDEVCDQEILQATFNQLNDLRLVIACGYLAYRTIASVAGIDRSRKGWKLLHGADPILCSIFGKNLLLATTFHPGARGEQARKKMTASDLEKNDCSGLGLLGADFHKILRAAGFEPRHIHEK